MDEEKNMDDLFREKFENFSVGPPAHVWTGIQSQLKGRRRKVRMAYIGWISAAAVVILALIAGWLLNNQSGQSVPEVLQKEASVQQAQPQETTIQENVLKENEAIIISAGPKEKQEKANVPEDHISPVFIAETTSKSQPENRISVRTQAISYRLLERVKGFAGIETETELAQRQPYAMKTSDYQETLSEADRILIAANTRGMRSKDSKEVNWIIGAHIDPGYSSHSSSYSDQYSGNMSYNPETGLANMGGGLSVQYKTGKRVRIESGIYYAQNGQKTGSSPSGRLFAALPEYDYAVSSELVTGSDIYSNSVNISQGELTMNTTAGVVKIESTPDGAVLASAGESETVSLSSVLSANGQFSQVFDFIEIPLYMRYNILDLKLGIDVVGGLNAGIVVGNNAYIDNNSGQQRIGSTEDISTLNLSATIGFGVNYALGRHLKLALEPRLNYYLNSINTSADVNYKPYRIGLYSGVYYAF